MIIRNRLSEADLRKAWYFDAEQEADEIRQHVEESFGEDFGISISISLDKDTKLAKFLVNWSALGACSVEKTATFIEALKATEEGARSLNEKYANTMLVYSKN